MAKQKTNTQVKPESTARQPKLTHTAYKVCLWIIVLGFLAQLVMAIMVYPSLPGRIPASWAGSAVPYNTVPSWLVFLVFPAAQLVLLMITIFSPKDDQGKRVMESGEAATLIVLAILFIALQASAFHIPYYGK